MSSVGDEECVGGDRIMPDSAVAEMVTRALSVCAVREFGDTICTI